MKKKIKKIIYLFIGRYARTRLFWRLKTIKILFSDKLLAPREEGEFNIAKKFSKYWNGLEQEEQKIIKNNLTKNLDTESIETINNFIFRQIFIAENNLLKQSLLFTKKEIDQQKECSKNIQKLTKKMNSYNFSFLPSECFYGLSGLKWLPDSITERIKEGIFIDVGACEGDTSIFLAMKFKPKHVYAFEPDNTNYEILKNNCNIFNKDLITTLKIGLSDVSEKSHLASKGSESHISTNKNDQELELIKFDDFWINKIEEKNKITLVKMDIEGLEMYALKGMEKTIKEQKPILAISIYHRQEDFFLIKPWLEKICPEYKFLIKKASPFSLTGETMLLAYIEK